MQIWRKLFSRGIKKMGPYRAKPRLELPNFDASQWITIWLALDDASQIKGKTVFVKQLFVTGKELAPSIDHTFRFFAHRYGPYSDVFNTALKEVIRKDLVSEIPHQEIEGLNSDRSPRLDYKLTPLGEHQASFLLGRIPQESRIALNKYRRMLSRMGFWGIIQYVYSNYPEYAISSEIQIA